MELSCAFRSFFNSELWARLIHLPPHICGLLTALENLITRKEKYRPSLILNLDTSTSLARTASLWDPSGQTCSCHLTLFSVSRVFYHHKSVRITQNWAVIIPGDGPLFLPCGVEKYCQTFWLLAFLFLCFLPEPLLRKAGWDNLATALDNDGFFRTPVIALTDFFRTLVIALTNRTLIAFRIKTGYIHKMAAPLFRFIKAL